MLKTLKRNWKNMSKGDRALLILKGISMGVFNYIILDIWTNVRDRY